MSTSKQVVIDGKILVDAGIRSFSGAIAYVYIEDVGLLDASAGVLGKQVIDDVSHLTGVITEIPFRVTFRKEDLSTDYSLRAHITLTGNEEINTGDFVTTQSYPVLKISKGNPIIVKVHEVK